MTVWEAIIQAVVQGLTEFLPVSSSGHLSLVQHFFGLNGEGSVTFSVVLHLGTLVAVFAAFWGKIRALILEFFSMVRDIFTGKFKAGEMNGKRRMIVMIIVSILPLFAFYIGKDFFTGLAEDADILVEGAAFLYTSGLLFLSAAASRKAEHSVQKQEEETTVADALTVGVFQGIALIPGVSRSGSTICGGLLRNFSREYAVEYSFILGIPVILAGAAVELKDAVTAPGGIALEWLPLLVGFAVSAVVGFGAIRLIQWLMKTNRFKIFAWYTLALGLVVIIISIFERIQGMTLPQYIAALSAV